MLYLILYVLVSLLIGYKTVKYRYTGRYYNGTVGDWIVHSIMWPIKTILVVYVFIMDIEI